MRAYSIAMALIYMPHKILFVFVTFQIDYLKQKRAQPKWSAKRDRRMKGLKEKGMEREREVEIAVKQNNFSSSPKIGM